MKLFLTAPWGVSAVAMSVAGLLFSCAVARGQADAPGEEAARVLAAHCLECHSGPKPKGKLDLTTRAGALAGGETAPAVAPGDLAKSLLWAQVSEDEMPPKKKLAASDKMILRRWLETGAVYEEDPIDMFRFTAGQRAGYDWWSLQPVTRPAPPKAREEHWIRNPIDAFVLAKLDARDLKHAPQADPRVLIRRLYFDLIGLPPEPEVIREFVALSEHDSQAAIEAAADKLLNSPRYGERWARHWLDVSRYGESNGFEYDQLRAHAWRFRQWVIDALNDDMAYDRFAQLQIAGDVLEPENPDAIVATSFLVCGAFDGLIPQGAKMRQIMRQDEMEDLVGTVAQSFLGLTVHCARCHDHKFDPIRQKEYYQMASALGGVRRGDRALPPDPTAIELSDRIEQLTRKISDLEEPIRDAILAASEAAPKTAPGSGPPAPTPVSRWTFDAGFEDELGQLDGVPNGGARIDSGALRLDGKDAFVSTPPLSATLKAKTLEAWVKLETLEQRGGGIVSVQSLDGGLFDSIVFGESEPRRWMAGSNGLSRTQSFQGEEESEAQSGFVHLAIVYSDDGTIAGYRNGLPYGKPYKRGGLASFPAGQSQVIFGLRHGSEPVSGRMLAGWIDRAQLYDRALSAAEVAASASISFVSEAQMVARLTERQKADRADWKEEIARLSAALQERRGRKAFAVTPAAAPVGHLLVRGSPFQPSDVVAAGGVAAVDGGTGLFGLDPDAPEADRRAALAKWITEPDNPLLARVMVNRLWHYHFGQGLVKTPNDFGYNGGIPSHPELLDWLAAEFRSVGWSMKAMHRLMVTSAAYQQSAASNAAAQQVDAGNRLIWRRTPARLEAETLRDTILAVAGQLNPAMGGPGFQDFDMHKHKGSWVYDPTDPEGAAFNRRSIYRTWARGSKHPLLSTFDCPDPSATAPVRGVTTTPLGALSLMNNSFVLRMADHFAERVRSEAGDDGADQIRRAYQLAFGRGPNPEELSLTARFAAKNGLPALCRVLFNSNEFLYVN